MSNHIDPRLNCAASICCPPPQNATTSDGTVVGVVRNPDSLRAAVAILVDAGVPDEAAPSVAKKLYDMGVAMLSTELAAAIRHIAFPDPA